MRYAIFGGNLAPIGEYSSSRRFFKVIGENSPIRRQRVKNRFAVSGLATGGPRKKVQMPKSGHETAGTRDAGLKGTVAWDFCPLVLVSYRLYLGLCILSNIFFRFLFRIRRVIRIRNSYCAMGHCGEPNFFAQTMDFKRGWCRLSLVLFIYINFLASLSL